MSRLPMCDCARTREFCRTIGCKRDRMDWRFTTEGREGDRLRRIIQQRDRRPVSRWVKPERAIAEAWVMNMEDRRGVIFIEKFGEFRVETHGTP